MVIPHKVIDTELITVLEIIIVRHIYKIDH